MNFAIIITISVLLLLAYAFTISSSKTKIPSVILLLLLGWVVKQATDFFHIVIPDLNSLLPLFGTIGLVLIVLEGSLELELNKRKIPFVGKTFVTAIIPLFITAFLIGHFFYYFLDSSYKDGLINAIPLCIISSAIAISSVGNLNLFNKEFAIYESSLSDIIGVLFFNFIVLNNVINLESVGNFALQILIMLIISFIATAFLAFLLSRIDHHVKFIPIVLLIILIYAVSEIYHLPALIFIMLFGIIMGNFDELERFKWVKYLKPRSLDKEVHKFKELTVEAAFLVRSLFFLLFGFLMKTEDILNPHTFELAIGIVVLIYLVRAIQLKIFKVKLMPLLYIAPRGLITILLFLSIPTESKIPLVNKALIIQVIVLTALIMMFGLIFNKQEDKKVNDNIKDKEENNLTIDMDVPL
ncbi:sodium:proton antiporter [Flavobacterium sp. 316]|uniref:Cation:proton antiporter n=1 Tax=Flavobacterium sediminilitoris TaxID=2024526 RepID=A0ABY4HK69_9FLAO|nr:MULTISPECIES: cation:proton antiporter [Flavobacterium]KIX22621.1 sodium:proton antiporter [Flavobacterium sp. 316]UOX32930.1 cation:proton antiporter [Flavobacterium sediminilitoris]